MKIEFSGNGQDNERREKGMICGKIIKQH